MNSNKYTHKKKKENKMKTEAEEIVEKIVEKIKMEENTDEKALLDLLYDLFFNISDLSYYMAGRMLTEAGVINRVGEKDSFGPLSWGVFLPQKREVALVWLVKNNIFERIYLGMNKLIEKVALLLLPKSGGVVANIAKLSTMIPVIIQDKPFIITIEAEKVSIKLLEETERKK